MFVLVIRTMASVGSWMVGSGTESTLTRRFACQVTAFMCALSASLSSISSTSPSQLLIGRHAFMVALFSDGDRHTDTWSVLRASNAVTVPVGPAVLEASSHSGEP